MNDWEELMLIIWIFINIVSTLLYLADWYDFGDIRFGFVNPIVIYKSVQVNVFGAILLAIIANIAFPVLATIYWIYKRYTVGRK